MSGTGRLGVLLLAFGAPRRPEEVEPFLAAVTGGRPLPPAVVAEYRGRYLRIGGGSPLPAIIDELAAALERRLASAGFSCRVAVGTLHWRPTLAEGIGELARAGVERAVAITLVPQYSAASVGRYLARLQQEMEAAGRPFPVAVVRSWATHPLLVRAFAQELSAALAVLPAATQVVFSAHSVPIAGVAEDDPFEEELRATAAAVAALAGVRQWRLAYQSAGGGGPWLGPTLAETVETLAASGAQDVLVVPIHFLGDNVEILYDIDIALRERAERFGVRLSRSKSLNASPLLVAALADLAAHPPA